MRKLALVSFSWLALGLATSASAQQVTGRVDSFAYIHGVGDASTTSTTAVPMPGMVLDISSRRGPVLISFCGKSSPVDIILVQAQVDGVRARPGEIVLDAEVFTEVPVFETHCFQFVAPNLRCGDHRIEMFFRSLEGGEIRIQERSLSAHFNDRGKAECGR